MAESHAITGNRGNMIVSDAPLGMFNADPRQSMRCNLVELEKRLGPDFADIVSDRFDYILISSSNIINIHGTSAPLLKPISALAGRIKIIILGVGLQGRFKFSDLSAEKQRLFRVMNDAADLFGVRGYETAAFLADNGLDNAVPLGCPSLYAHPRNIINIGFDPGLLSRPDLRLLVAGYLENPARAFDRRSEQLLTPLKGRKISYVLQGPLDAGDGDAKAIPHYDSALCQLDPKATRQCCADRIPDGVEIEKFFYFNSVPAWRQACSWHDLYVGDRFHGGIAAMSAGVPAIFLFGDNRVDELTQYFDLPRAKLGTFRSAGLEATVEATLSPHALKRMRETYVKRFRNFQAEMKTHGLALKSTLCLPDGPRP